VVHAVEALDRDLLAVLHGGMEQALDDDAFNALALRLFAYQYDANIPYHKYCQRRGQTPETVQHWQQIPAVPRSGRACRRAPDRSRLCPGRNPAHELGPAAQTGLRHRRGALPELRRCLEDHRLS
jgi:hypothetical protein